MGDAAPELSVIIPTLNEGRALPRLLQELAEQQAIRLEIIVVDGGSSDATAAGVKQFANQTAAAVMWLRTGAGRGRQLNRGARAATADELLFLHADTSMTDPHLLAAALKALRAARESTGDRRVAGHFGLRFLRSSQAHCTAYYFYECKTRLNRPECVNGDQGFMLSRAYFEELGQFDESLGYMEDARLARTVFRTGRWITLPGLLNTSARRFEAEGLKERQTLNALLLNFDVIGFVEFFDAARNAYRSQEKSGRLRLRPFLLEIHRLVRRRGAREAVRLWYKTGCYVAQNAWQLAFALDCRRNYQQQYPPGTGPTPRLDRYDKWLGPLLTTPAGGLLTALATLAWFYGLLAKSLISPGK